MEQHFSDALDSIETKLKALAKKLLVYKQENEVLRDKYTAFKEMENEIVSLKSQNNTLMQAKQTRGIVQEENAKLKAFQEKNQALQNEINKIKKAQESYDNRFEQEKRKLKAVQNTNQQLLTENSKLRNVQKQSPNIAPASDEKIQELELENNRLKQQIEKDKRRVSELQETLSQNFNSTHIQKTSPDNTRIKREIDLYITEIDKCIELIKE